MKKIIPLSLLTLSLLNADVILEPLEVQATTLSDVAQNAQTSADVAQTLSSNIPSVDMSRRSGIANDVLIRGQKRDNISVEADGTKVYGACPNRMDPPVSHILASQIESIEVTEGPYDVTTYGNMSGGLKITTKQPTKEIKGQINLGFGAWNYKKFGATVSGGNDLIRVLVTASKESSDQYKDGDGHTLAQQVIANGAPVANQYQAKYEDMQAYTKQSMMAKAFVTTAKDQELRLSVTANRSDNIMYANSPMDAILDDSNIYSIAYNIDNISDIYKNINLQYYYSDVDHPMSTEYRNAALIDAQNKTNHMWTTMQGIKLKNSFDIDTYKILLGVDASKRTWRGEYVNNVSGAVLGNSIDHATTQNSALFTTLEKTYGDFDVKFGARYDYSTVDSDLVGYDKNTYNALNANVFTTYALAPEHKIFVGVGQASRVPDGRELYFQKGAAIIGTPDLKQTTNREIDFGYETNNDDFKLKIKGFYSMLQDYIYINSNKTANLFENIDATIYGAEISGSYYVNDDITVDMGASYKVGKKDTALTGQTDKDLADIAPLRANLAINYEYANNSVATIETQASDAWSAYDADNGEQALAGWAILNMKIKHAVNKKFNLTIGANNLFDVTYAQSNTYADLTLITAGTTQAMLLNEPGRYIYTNLDFKF
ncbi:TonB-dependent receptor [Sulfurimonas sp.]|uniref:TonB-dependent receptor domain-containing protein n=1 Tax=Sulfurimonas sp. TaxID=2022749 RepID=UPI002633C6B0|nr:TonB-dependent receptor [Sulfurimonas sp.]